MKLQDRFYPLVHNPEMIYLDSAASTLTLNTVVEAMDTYYKEYRANTHRGLYESSIRATDQVEKVRSKIATYLDAEPNQTIFTSGTTAGLNHVARSLFEMKPKVQVAITDMEHHSNHLPWLHGAKQQQTELTIIPSVNGSIDLEALDKICDTTKIDIFAFPWVSNIFGVTQDVEAILEITKKHQIVTVVDACQGMAHSSPEALKETDIIAFSGHKMYGPTGVGVVRLSSDLAEKLSPFFLGGGMIDEVQYDSMSYAKSPSKFEAGTLPIAEIIGLEKVIDWLKEQDLKEVKKQEISLAQKARDLLTEYLQGVEFIGNDRESTIVSFHHPQVPAFDLMKIMAEEHVAVRGGHHCVQPYHHKINASGTVRISFGIYNSEQDLEKLERALMTIQRIFL